MTINQLAKLGPLKTRILQFNPKKGRNEPEQEALTTNRTEIYTFGYGCGMCKKDHISKLTYANVKQNRRIHSFAHYLIGDNSLFRAKI